MNEKILFELKDIAPQLEPQQLKEFEHIIYMAKTLGEPQQVNGLLKLIIVWPSGKMSFKKEQIETIPSNWEGTAAGGRRCRA